MEKRLKEFPGHVMGEIKDFKELLNRADTKYSDKIAFEYKKNSASGKPEYMKHTFHEYAEEARNLGTALLEMGFEGKRIALIGQNRYEWCTSYISVLGGDMVIVPLDKALPNIEIKSLIQRSKADAVIFDSKYLSVFQEIKKEQKSNLSCYICMDKVEEEGMLNYSDLVEKGRELRKNGDQRYEKVKIDNEKMSVMLFTSGTTTISKAVMLSHHNICSNINAMPHFVLMYESDVLLSFLPLHHTFECTITFLYGCLYCGATVAFCDGLKHIVNNLTEYGVTVFVGVPLMLEMMYKKIMKGIEKQGKASLIKTMTPITNALATIHIDIKRKIYKQVLDNLGGKLRLVLYGGAPMEKSTIKGLAGFGIDMVQGYGLTETSPVITAETDHFKRPGSAGLVMKNEEVKIDQPNEEGIGEVVVKGPNVMLGYYENEEATKEVLKDGWFYTGDLGYFDQDGYLYLTGRKKDVIVLKNGKNIYPQEIEFLISKLPFVEENIVYGKPVKNNDYLISSKIVYNPDVLKELYPEANENQYQEIIWKQIKEQINNNMPDYKHIKEIIVTKEPLIKTTTQKVKRSEEMKKLGIIK
ncbi:MAG: AMP-dependent synthetase/ligase [Clostridia bacterium]